MQLAQAVELIKHPINSEKSIWADLGCGDGLFTNALSQLLAKGSLVYAVDKNRSALNKVSVKDGVQLKKFELDFINSDLPFKDLSGILMANSFHYIKDKKNFIQKIINHLLDDGYFIIVEYDTDQSNTWVPYPFSFISLKKFFSDLQFSVIKLHEISSRYNGTIYSAIIKLNDKPLADSKKYRAN